MKKIIVLFSIIFLWSTIENLSAQVVVDVNMDVNHTVGGSTSFDRSKWMTIHSSQGENDWNGDEDKLDYIINELDVYFGRDTGLLRWYSSLIKEDPFRPGHASPEDIRAKGASFKKNYGSRTDRHAFEKGDIIMALQQAPFYPNGANPLNTNDSNNTDWFFSEADSPEEPFGSATGEFLGRFFNDFFGDGGPTGQQRPQYFEVMNEPLWPLVDFNLYGGGNIDDIFKFHATIAEQLRSFSPEVKVGGFATAFPDHDKRDFQQWEERWKRFIDEIGPKMDFYSIHLYDFPIFPSAPSYRKGGRNEVTFELIEQYNFLKYGEVKPMIISEYGAQTHALNNSPWSPLRDWYNIESFNGMLMQMLERPNTIARALPFAVAKAEWGLRIVNGQQIPYTSRLLRKASEPISYSGNEWVWTHFIKFYELWSEVKGLRADTYSTEPNLQVDSYIDGRNTYVILNNLKERTVDFQLHLHGQQQNNTLQNIHIKRLYLNDDDIPVLETLDIPDFSGTRTLRDNETIILKYTFKEAIIMEDSSKENKYYANTYKQAITDVPLQFQFDQSMDIEATGEAVLRLGLYRPHDKSKSPSSLMINGTLIENIPDVTYRGDAQINRDAFFSLLEIPIDYELLQATDNAVQIGFPDEGGILATAALQTFGFSRPIPRTKATVSGLNEVMESQDLLLLSSPSSTTVTVIGAFATWEIRSVTGQPVQRGRSSSIDISELPHGIYFIIFDEKDIKKIIKH